MRPWNLFRRPAWRGVWLGLACALMAWGLTRTRLCRGLEDWMLDGCFAWRGTRPTAAPVVLIGLDEASLRGLGKSYAYVSPELAEVVRYANRQGAAAIGLDVLVPEDMSDLADIATPNGPGDAAPLGQAVREAGNVVLPQWRLEDGWQRPLLQWQAKALHPALGGPTDLAFVNLTEDGDQFVRRQQLLLDADGQPAFQFALAVYAVSRGAAITWDQDGTPRVGGEPIPVDAEAGLRINFAGPPGTFAPVPFHQVLADARAGRARPEWHGAVVLVGVTARTGQDYHPTPYANHYARWLPGPTPGLMAGTELQAHVLATLYDRAFIRTPPWLAPLPLLLVVGVVLGYSFARLNLAPGFLLAVGHHFAWKLLALTAFSWFHWRVHLVGMLVLGALLYAATFAWRWRTLRRMLGVVKSEAVALALENDPHRLDRAGEEREVTVLFADIRGFTDYSERHTPHEVVALLNAYFDAVVPLLEAEGGVIDKYMGDGIMALFGAPRSCPDHALRGVRVAVAMVARVHQLRGRWTKLGNAGLRIGVGVHTGWAVVGAIGSRRRLDFTAVGDTVNAASRIESENKPQGTEVLVSGATLAALPPGEAARLGCAAEPRRVRVKGKEEELLLYPVVVP